MILPWHLLLILLLLLALKKHELLTLKHLGLSLYLRLGINLPINVGKLSIRAVRRWCLDMRCIVFPVM